MTSADTPALQQADAAEPPLQGRPLSELMGAPLIAALEAQVGMAKATEDFIKSVGFTPPSTPGGAAEARTVSFGFSRPVPDESDPARTRQEEVQMEVPLLALVKVPSLQIDTMDISFDVAVTGWGSASETGPPPTAEAVLADPNLPLRTPGYTITMKVVSAEPTDAMARVMDQLAGSITPVIQPR